MNLPVVGLVYIAFASLFTFTLCWVDKRRAKKGRWRISEPTLLLAGLLGGCLGLLLGMNLFRHKTQKLKFRVIVPLECILWVVVLVYLLSN